MKDKPQIFLSYAYEDRAKVIGISRELAKAGFQTWLDVENLLPGQDWEVEIRKALKESDFVFIFLTRNSTTKEGYLQKEINSALRLADEKPEGAIYLIPIKLEDVEVPDSLKHIQWLEFYKSDGLKKLFEALNVNLKRKLRDNEQLRSSVEEIEKPRRNIFVAMPFSEDLQDCYYYGIRVPIKLAGFNCIRVDKTSFTGDILIQIKQDIEKSVAVVALLDGANPNVSLEVGYAWGRQIPTILLIKDTTQLPFDLRGQKCLIYESIRGLEKILTNELRELMDKGIIQ